MTVDPTTSTTSATSTTSTAPTGAPAAAGTVTIDIWSDVVCPWCYIGKRRFASGLDETRTQLAAEGLDVDFEVSYHAYQLDPTASPGRSEPVVEAYAKKFGGRERAEAILHNVTDTAAGVGLEFNMDRALRANTLLAHRLIWLAGQPDSPVAQDAMKEQLLAAYFTDGADIGDVDVLADRAAAAGFDRDAIVEYLASDRGVEEVADDLRSAHENGITAVPTYVINGQWAIPGAQEPETFAQVLTKMARKLAAVDAQDSE